MNVLGPRLSPTPWYEKERNNEDFSRRAPLLGFTVSYMPARTNLAGIDIQHDLVLAPPLSPLCDSARQILLRVSRLAKALSESPPHDLVHAAPPLDFSGLSIKSLVAASCIIKT